MDKRRLKQVELDKKRKIVEDQYGDDGRTDYSRKRSRRKAATKYQDASSGSLEFVDCRNYRTDVQPGSTHSDAQPFSIDVGVGAAIMVDLHSHFTKCEVIGYLAVSFFCCFLLFVLCVSYVSYVILVIVFVWCTPGYLIFLSFFRVHGTHLCEKSQSHVHFPGNQWCNTTTPIRMLCRKPRWTQCVK